MPKKLKNLIIIFTVITAIFTMAHFALALDTGTGYAVNIGLGEADPRDISVNVIKIAMTFLGIIAVCVIMYAGWLWMTAGGDAVKIDKAKKTLIGAIIGLIITLSAWAVVTFILNQMSSITGEACEFGVDLPRACTSCEGAGTQNCLASNTWGPCSTDCAADQSCCSGVCAVSCLNMPGFFVNSTSPGDGDIDVIRNVKIKYNFSRKLNEATVDNTTFRVEDSAGQIPGAIEVINNKRIEFTLENPVADGLVAWWKMDQGEGGESIDSAGSNNSTIYGAEWRDMSECKIGRCLYFDGVDDYVNCGNDASLDFGIGDFSVSVWFKINQLDDGAYIVNKGAGNYIDGYGLVIGEQTADDKLRFVTDGNDAIGAKIYLASDNALEESQWYNVVALRKEGIKYLYLNGVQQSTTQSETRELSDISRSLKIGQADVDLNKYFNGLIDDVRIYNRALTDLEIDQIYNSSRYACPPNACGVINCFPANEDITVTAESPGGILSLGDGIDLDCGLGSPCVINFTTSDTVDCAKPEVSLSFGQVCATANNLIEATASDDSGVTNIEFYDPMGLIEDVVNPSPIANNPFDASIFWDGTVFLPDTDIVIEAIAYDMDDNNDNDRETIRLRPAHCCNDALDEADGEEGVDCGGSCAACSGAACGISFSETCAGDPDPNCDNNQCASGLCACFDPVAEGLDYTCQDKGYEEGIANCCVCQEGPVIDWVSPVGGFCSDDINQFCQDDSDCGGYCDKDTPNGAENNIITIGGRNFGVVEALMENILTNVDFEIGAVGSVPTDWSKSSQSHSSVGVSQIDAKSGIQSVLLHQDPNQVYGGTCTQAICNDIVSCTWIPGAPNQCSFPGVDHCHPVAPSIYNEGESLCWGNTHRVMWLRFVYNVAPLGWQVGEKYVMKFYYKGRSDGTVGIRMAYSLGWAAQCIPEKLPYIPVGETCEDVGRITCADQPGYCCIQAPFQTKCYTALYLPSISAGVYNDWTVYSTSFTYTEAMANLLDKNGNLRNEIGMSIGYNTTGPNGTDLYIDDFTIAALPSVGGVKFLGDADDPTDDILANFPSSLNPLCASNWQDNQIIVLVPEGAVSGPIEITAESGHSDRTDNNYGPEIDDFVVNTIVRPGLCSVTPNSGVLGNPFNLQGINFDAGSREVLFGNKSSNVLANNIQNWTDTSVDAEMPYVEGGKTSVFVKINNINSNFLDFTSNQEYIPSGPHIASFEPIKGSEGQYVTIYGSGFGQTKGVSTVHFGDELGPEANYEFPDVCSGSIWSDNQVIVKVPPTADGNYTITMAIGGSDTINTDGLSPNQFNVDSSLTLAPSACKIQPLMGPNNSPVSLWGEYFGDEATGLVRFQLNHDQSGADIISWGPDGDADKVETAVHQDAVSGQVKVVQAGLEGNGLNFTVGPCSEAPDPDAACGTDICCPVGSTEEGRCHTALDDCYITVTSSVYEWDFSTVGPTAVGDPCYESAVATPFCTPTSPACTALQFCDPATCTCQPIHIESCMGYGTGECADNLCPNSPGQCSHYAGGGTAILGECSDDYCNDTHSVCAGNCEYDSDLNKCKLTGASCNLSRTVQDGLGNDVAAYCAEYGGAGRWHINISASCPADWSNIGDNKCIEDGTTCNYCDSGLSCLDDGGSGICAIDQDICPIGSNCDSSLVGLWKLNEGAGATAFDSSGNGNDGILTNMDPATDWVGGKIGGALEFDGVNDYIAIQNLHYDTVGAISELTVSAWVKIPTNGGNWSIVDFDRSEYFNCVAGISSGNYSGEGDYVGFHTTNSSATINDMWSSSTVRDNNWHFITWVFDSSQINDKKIYIDGSLDASKDAYSTGINLGSGATRYGFIGDGSEATTFDGARNKAYFEGIIDEVAIYNRALGAEEILEHYKQGAERYCLAADSATCECCCRIGFAAQDCCVPLDCTRDCGSDKSGTDTNTFGYCTGCAMAANPDAACNCFGHFGKFCDSSDSDYPEGVCRDCAQLSTVSECLLHPASCCADLPSGLCMGGDIIPAPGPNEGYCDYYDCQAPPNEGQCDATPVISGAYKDILGCDAGCSAEPPVLPGLSCHDSDTDFCEKTCLAGTVCLGDTGCLDNNPAPPPPACGAGDASCLCCCNPNNDECGLINPDLTCTPDSDPCTTSFRGLCCGCAQDDQCGDPDNISCGFDGCCRPRPQVIARYPLDEDDAGYAPVACRNTMIKAVFDQEMDISSFSGKVIVVGDYGAEQCPEGTEFLVKKDIKKQGRIGRAFNKIVKFFKKIIKPISYLAKAYGNPPQADHNYCAIKGVVSGYNNAADQGVLTFSPSQLLDAGRRYYVIIKGDSNLTDNISQGVLSYYDISMNGGNSMIPVQTAPFKETFNARTYTNAHIWTFRVGGVASVPDSSLAGHWQFDEGAGSTAFDISGNGNNGTLTNMDPTTDWVDGKIGGALEFDGVDDCVLIPDSPSLDIVNNITLEAWFINKGIGTGFSSNWAGMIIAKHFTHNKRSYDISIKHDTKKIRFGFFEPDNTSHLLDSNSLIVDDQWYYVVATYDKATGMAKIYLNGGLDISQNIGSFDIMQTAMPATTGCYLNSDDGSELRAFFNGTIDDVRIYSRALSAEEIQAIYSFQRESQVCELDYITMDPPSYLFQTAYDTQTFLAEPKNINGQDITAIPGVYNWQWSWSSDNTSVANAVMQAAPNENQGDVTSQNVKDGKTYIKAIAAITEDTVMDPSTVGRTKEGKALVHVFLCENPWPPVPVSGIWEPWIDSVTNCTIPAAGCFDTSYELYYCRDAGGEGTADDFPPILSGVGDSVIRGSSTVQNVLKEIYYLREETPVSAAGLTVIDNGIGGSVTVGWPDDSIADPDIIGYKLYYGTDSGNYDTDISLELATTPGLCAAGACNYQITGLTNNTVYYFVVSSYYGTGAESDYSNEEDEVPTDSTAPFAPTDLTAAFGDGQIDLNWTASVSPDVEGYKVYYGTSPGVYGAAEDVGDVSGVMVTGLTNGQRYYFAVIAYDNYNNESGYSIEVTERSISDFSLLLGTENYPAISCKHIIESNSEAQSGAYWIKDSANEFEVFCDMETDGGGWTRIDFASDFPHVNRWTTGDAWRWLPSDFETVLSLEQIQAIQNVSTEGKQRYDGTCQGVLHYYYTSSASYAYAFGFRFLNGDETNSGTQDIGVDFAMIEDGCKANDGTFRHTIWDISDARVPIVNVRSRDNGDSGEMFGSVLSENPAWLR